MSDETEPKPPTPTWKAVYTIIERSGGRKHWLRIGTAFVNRDGSLNVVLDAVPITGKLHIRDPNSGPGAESRPPATDKPASFREGELGGGAADDDIPF